MAKVGRPAWKPTAAERRQVEHYMSIGYTQGQIAGLMDCSEPTLRTHFAEELKNGALKVNAQIGGKLFQKAMGGDTASLIFWAKTRMGWREKPETGAGTIDAIEMLAAIAEHMRN